MTYTGAMVLPQNAVVLQEEEMRYLEGGFKMKTAVATGIINGISYCLGIYLSGLGSVKALISKVGKSKAAKIATELALKVGVTAARAKQIGGFVGAVTGFTIGGGIAYLLDRYDTHGKKYGKANGWIQY